MGHPRVHAMIGPGAGGRARSGDCAIALPGGKERERGVGWEEAGAMHSRGSKSNARRRGPGGGHAFGSQGGEEPMSGRGRRVRQPGCNEFEEWAAASVMLSGGREAGG